MQVTVKNFGSKIWKLAPKKRRSLLHTLFTQFLSPASLHRLEKIERAFWNNKQNWSHEKYAEIQNKAIIQILKEATTAWGQELHRVAGFRPITQDMIIWEEK